MFPIATLNNPDRSKLRAAFPQIEALFRTFAEQHPIPGVAYGIVIDGELVLAGGTGVQNVTSQTPVNADSVFRIASMTKSFTAMALMQRRDEGKFNLDDAVEKHVPELAALPYPTRDSAKITVRQLLTMSAGFPQDDPWADRQLAASESDLSAWMAKGITFSNPPGVKYEYSNFGYAILGRIVTNVAGVLYQDYVTENILKPLGMTSTTFDVSKVDPQRLAMGYRRQDGEWIEEPPLPDGAFASIGGLFTTINDFARYMNTLLAAFPPRDEAESGPLKRSSLREMMQGHRQRMVSSSRATPDVPAWYMSDGYGYGLACGVDSLLGYSVSHGGGLPGYGTFYRLLPEANVGIVALGNVTYSSISLRVQDACVMLQQTGGLVQRVVPPSDALLDIQKGVNELYETWSDEGVKALSTESFFLDMALERRRKQVQDLRASYGKVLSSTAFEAENNLRGRWWMQCENGRIEAYITLSPTVPPKMQTLQLIAAKLLSAGLQAAVDRVVSLIGGWDEAQAGDAFAPTVDRAAVQRQLAAVGVQYGSITLGEALEGDGGTQTRVRLVGTQGITDMKVVLDAESGKISAVTFSRPRETMFVP
ncbi:MAG: beta-lactamase family protein [Anaerolineae bacterium]|nr:beta-lactamase family protein [Anaerolineae bacterium]